MRVNPTSIFIEDRGSLPPAVLLVVFILFYFIFSYFLTTTLHKTHDTEGETGCFLCVFSNNPDKAKIIENSCIFLSGPSWHAELRAQCARRGSYNGPRRPGLIVL